MRGLVTIDAVEINSLVAARPERILVVLEREPGGLWQLTLVDPEKRREWRLGYYIDGYEGKEVELQDELRMEWPITESEPLWRGAHMRVRIDGGKIRVEIGAWRLEYPRLCRPASHALLAPVYIGTTAEGRHFVLDCIGWRAYPGGLEGLEREVEMSRCSQCGRLHWLHWCVVHSGEIVDCHYRAPRPGDVAAALRAALGQ